jgi:cytochrome c peroxidase
MRPAAAADEDLDRLITSDADIASLGRFAVTRNPAETGHYKTPSLQNVAITAPYMHDGSVATLEDAVERELYYRSAQSNRPVVLTPEEKSDLVAFLRSLTSPLWPLSEDEAPRQGVATEAPHAGTVSAQRRDAPIEWGSRGE